MAGSGTYDEVLGPDSPEFKQATEALAGSVPKGFYSNSEPGQGGFLGYDEVPSKNALGSLDTWESWGELEPPKHIESMKKVVTGREWELGMPVEDPHGVVRSPNLHFA